MICLDARAASHASASTSGRSSARQCLTSSSTQLVFARRHRCQRQPQHRPSLPLLTCSASSSPDSTSNSSNDPGPRNNNGTTIDGSASVATAATATTATTPAAAAFPASLETTPAPRENPVLQRDSYSDFVAHFRTASSYIANHRNKTFVVLLPGEVVARKDLLRGVVSDLCLLHGLGVRLVVALGTKPQVDGRLQRAGSQSRFVDGYRVTDAAALSAAVDAAGAARLELEAAMSAAIAVSTVRRHERALSNSFDEGDDDDSGDNDDERGRGRRRRRGRNESSSRAASSLAADEAAHLRVVSGNFVAARRRGVVGGVDFGATGAVRRVAAPAVRDQLERGNVVLLSNVGTTARGEPLNLSCFDVAAHAAVELRADKLVCLTLADVAALRLPAWLPLTDAQQMLDAAFGPGGEKRAPGGAFNGDNPAGAASSSSSSSEAASPPPPPPPISRSLKRAQSWPAGLDADTWQRARVPPALVAAVAAAARGVKRSHLVDARVDGGLLLELYSRDGVGTMVSDDFYEGIRRATAVDVEGIAALLAPLERAGTTRARTREQLEESVARGEFTVVERDATLLACAALADVGTSPDGLRCGELAAFCVSPEARNSGRGDSLLDFVEQRARELGMDRVLLLTTVTADWFVQRDFLAAGLAAECRLLPEERRARVDASRGSKIFVKSIVPLDGARAAPAGKRIGF